MAIIKTIAKILLFISIVLAVGQVSVAHDTVGSHFVQNVKKGTLWTVGQITESKMFSQVPVPDFLKDLFPKEEPKGKVKKQRRISEAAEGTFSTADRQEVLKLLRN